MIEKERCALSFFVTTKKENKKLRKRVNLQLFNWNCYKDYILSLYNNCKAAAETIYAYEDMLSVIIYVMNVEHVFPSGIGGNELSNSYIVGLDFTWGYLYTLSIIWYEWKRDRLVEK